MALITDTAGKRTLSATRPRLLDLFCAAGGSAMGYWRAGFEVVGVDIKPQPNYPFSMIVADALDLDVAFVKSFDAIHASPPCQAYSVTAYRTGKGDTWPKLIEPTRSLLEASDRPYVIENVVGAPLQNFIVLCGTMFPGLRVIRHRLFEANFPIFIPSHRKHPLVHTLDKRKRHYGKTDESKDFVTVTGGGNCSVEAAKDAMGIDWMTKKEMNEAIPPDYTEASKNDCADTFGNVLAKLLGTLNFKKSLDPPPNGRVVFENCETKKDGLFAPIPMTLLYD